MLFIYDRGIYILEDERMYNFRDAISSLKY